MAFLIAALLLFAGFHFLPSFGNQDRGWHVWPNLLRAFPDFLTRDPKEAVIIASFLNFSVLIVASPFLSMVWPKSRLAWWFALTFSGLAAAGFWVVFLLDIPDSPPEYGGWCLMMAPMLNFAGLLLARAKTDSFCPPAAI